MTDAVAGWPALLRLALRRDRVLVPAWVVALALATSASAAATTDLYPTVTARVQAAEDVNGNPALLALYSPVADPTSLGALATFKLMMVGAVLVALLAVVVVRRHTRAEEESGRAEALVAAGAGRHALLTAALVEAALAVVATCLLTALADVAVGLDRSGSVLFGAAWAGLGLAVAGTTALVAQLSASTRTVGGVVAAVLGGSFLLRAAGDLGSWGWLTWVSPFGWVAHVDAYAVTPHPAVLGLLVGLAVLTTLGAVVLAGRRDLGQGLLTARPGRATGRLASPGALTVRVLRVPVVAWTLAFGLLGVLLGLLVPSVERLLGAGSARELVRRVGGSGSLVDSFLATELSFVAVGASALAVLAVTRLADEEEEGRTGLVLAAGVPRWRVLGAGVGLGMGWTALAVLVLGVALSAVGGRVVVGAALAQLPAVWVLTGAAVLLLGLRRSWAGLAWVLLALVLLLGQVGELLGLPRWLVEASPYAHTPRLPAEPFALGPEVVLTLVALGLGVAGGWAYLRREIA